jgi:hypothetical protein
MNTKFYAFLLLAFFARLMPVQAQDTLACNAGFLVEPNGTQVYFRAIDSISGVQHYWYFGDSTQVPYGNNVGVEHSYSHAGKFTVIHLIRNLTTGCHDSSSQTITINPVTDSTDSVPPPILPTPASCTVAFNEIPNPANAEQYTFVLQDSAAYDSVVWMVRGWSGTDSILLKQATGRAFSYTFPHPGIYDVLVSAQADSGNFCNVWTIQAVNVDTGAVAANSYIASYPNPASNQVGVDVKLAQPETINVQVYNSMGNPVLSTSVSGYTGTNHVNLPLGNLGTGVYYIQVQYGNVIKRSQVQKL